MSDKVVGELKVDIITDIEEVKEMFYILTEKNHELYTALGIAYNILCGINDDPYKCHYSLNDLKMIHNVLKENEC